MTVMRFPALFRRNTPQFEAPLAPEIPFSAIGDIHGRKDLLDRLLPDLPVRPWIFVGDYVDRGDDSAGVLRTLAALDDAQGDDVICLSGNHEQMLLTFLENPAQAGPSWLRFGGLQTLASFGVAPPLGVDPTPDAWNETAQAAKAALGADLITWIAELPVLWQTGNVSVVHAGADPAEPIGAQPPNTLIWGHDDFESQPRTDGVWVVHGHTIVDQPWMRQGKIAIDTGAYATGRLTAAQIGDDSVEFVTSS